MSFQILPYPPSSVLLSGPFSLLAPAASSLPACRRVPTCLGQQGLRPPWPTLAVSAGVEARVHTDTHVHTHPGLGFSSTGTVLNQ